MSLRAKAENLANEGEEMRTAVFEMQDTNKQLSAEAGQLEDGVNGAMMRQQEAEDDLSVLEPKHDLMKQEYARVQTTIAELRLDGKRLEADALAANDAEERLELLMQNVVHRSMAEMLEHEKELDATTAQLQPQMLAANKARSQGRQELTKLRGKISVWTDTNKAPELPEMTDLTEQQRMLSRTVHSALEDSKRGPAPATDKNAAGPEEASPEDRVFHESMMDNFQSTFHHSLK